jgi:uncharacterized protein (TIGR02300 family)
MPELNLGTKFECFSCGTRFYDLGKAEAICPKCGANQKDSDRAESASASAAARKRRKVEPKPVEIDDEPIEEIAADEEIAVGEVELEDLGGGEAAEEEEEEDVDDEA